MNKKINIIIGFVLLCTFEASAKSTVNSEILETWNRTDLHINLNDWPGKMKIKGNWGVVKEASRVMKLYKADIPEPYVTLYSKDEYMLKALRQTRSILGSYMKKPGIEITKQFLDSPWAKRYIRYDYVQKLAADCDVDLTEIELNALTAYFELSGPSPAPWACAGNPALRELPLP